jgi:hypothetical protein
MAVFIHKVSQLSQPRVPSMSRTRIDKKVTSPAWLYRPPTLSLISWSLCLIQGTRNSKQTHDAQ